MSKLSNKPGQAGFRSVKEKWIPVEASAIAAAPFTTEMLGAGQIGSLSPDGYTLFADDGLGLFRTDNLHTLSSTRTGVYFSLPDPSALPDGSTFYPTFIEAVSDIGSLSSVTAGAAISTNAGNWEVAALGDNIGGSENDGGAVFQILPWSAGEEYCLAVDDSGAFGTVYLYTSAGLITNGSYAFTLAAPVTEAMLGYWYVNASGEHSISIIETPTSPHGTVTQLTDVLNSGQVDPASYPDPRKNLDFEVEGLPAELILQAEDKGSIANGDTVRFDIAGNLSGVVNNRDLAKVGLESWEPTENISISGYKVGSDLIGDSFTTDLSQTRLTTTGLPITAPEFAQGPATFVPSTSLQGLPFKITTDTLVNPYGFLVAFASADATDVSPPSHLAFVQFDHTLNPNEYQVTAAMPIVGDFGATNTVTINPIDEMTVVYFLTGTNPTIALIKNGNYSPPVLFHEFIGGGAGSGALAVLAGFANAGGLVGSTPGTVFETLKEADLVNSYTSPVIVLESSGPDGTVDPASYPANRANKTIEAQGMAYPLELGNAGPIFNRQIAVFGRNADPLAVLSPHAEGDVVSTGPNTFTGDNTFEGTTTVEGPMIMDNSTIPIAEAYTLDVGGTVLHGGINTGFALALADLFHPFFQPGTQLNTH